MNAIAEDIRNNIDIVDVVGRYVSLKKSGSNFVGLSPFRQEKTPSFVVSPHKQIFKDFGGDGLGGDVITFVMEIENVDFMDAVRILSKDAGIDLSKYDSIQIDKKHEQTKEKIKKLGRIAQDFFHKRLLDSEKALSYLHEKRKLSDGIIKKFQLGYAPDSYYDLLQHIKKSGFSEDDILQGSLGKRGHGGDSFSFFRDRLMIPIFDKMGNTIGFGGRALDKDTQPKYINTTDTPVYDKSKVLYGINFLRDGLRLHDFVIVVEGYMDVIALSRMGYDNAVATCGTSLTTNHIKTIKRYSDHIYLLFDMDNAGFQATMRALKLAYTHDVYPQILSLPGDHKDIDDLVNSFDEISVDYSDVVDGLLDSGEDAISFVISRLEGNYDMYSPVDKKRFLDEVFSMIAYISSPTIQHGYLEMIASRFALDVNYLISQFKTYKKQNHRLLSRQLEKPAEKRAFQIDGDVLVAALGWDNYLSNYESFEGKSDIEDFFDFLLGILGDDDVMKMSRSQQVVDQSFKDELLAAQLWRDKELDVVEGSKKKNLIVHRIHTYISSIMKRLPKMKKISNEDFLKLQSLRKKLLV